MVGRRLLKCSDLVYKLCVGSGWTRVCYGADFEDDCDDIVIKATSAANSAKRTAIDLKDAAIKLKDEAISKFTKAVKDAEAAATEATRKFTELGDGIQCALPLQNPRAHNRRANGLAR